MGLRRWSQAGARRRAQGRAGLCTAWHSMAPSRGVHSQLGNRATLAAMGTAYAWDASTCMHMHGGMCMHACQPHDGHAGASRSRLHNSRLHDSMGAPGALSSHASPPWQQTITCNAIRQSIRRATQRRGRAAAHTGRVGPSDGSNIFQIDTWADRTRRECCAVLC